MTVEPRVYMSVEPRAPATDGLEQVRGQDQPEIHLVRLAALSVGYSPRHDKLDEEHVRALLEVVDRLPPVIVDRRTMRVLDGVHRLEASRRAGRTEMRAVLFSGDETEALVVAVQANIRHGKPLSRAERQAAAAALLRRCPERSDRWVAEVCGLSHSTVARVRQAAAAMDQGTRIGRDGRRRPVDPAQGQATLARALEEAPGRSVREVARVVGVTPSTAHRAAARIRSTTALVSRAPLAGAPAATGASGTGGVSIDLGRAPEIPGPPGMGAWLARTAVAPRDLDAYLAELPLSRAYEVVDECRRRAHAWADMADALEKHVRARQGTRLKPA
jgi:ParB-like chromosome segregation protein Spo0J